MKYILNSQLFGGRGASIRMKTGKDYSNVGKFLTGNDSRGASTSSGWDYRGEAGRTDTLIEYANKAKSINQINRAAIALKKEDEHISTLMNTVKEDDGDIRALMTFRRKIREQRKKTRL